MKNIAIFLILAGCVATQPDFDAGNQYLGAQYLSDPLGEGVPPDADPLIRFDAFDCTTFVETALAGGDLGKLNKIRYRDGIPTFLNRNHFIESDWLPNNSDMLENVSAMYGDTKIRTVKIDKQSWLHTTHGINADYDPVVVSLEYIPYEKLTSINNERPLVVLFITGHSEKSAKIGTDLAVVHMGFLLPGDVLRHASSDAGKVLDTNFTEYAKQRSVMPNNLGVAIIRIK